jgi:hypothetical protein
MATTDPKTTLRTGILTNLGNIKKDDGITNASIIHIWEGGPETLKYLFYTANYDVVISYGEPQSRAIRKVQDVPVHYLMSYPVTVTTADKPLTGVLVCTASAMQYKVTYALRAAVKAFAQSAPAATPAYTLSIQSDTSTYKRVGGIYVYETKHSLEYETDYA